MWPFMKASMRVDWETGIQTLRGYKLYEWQRTVLNKLGGNFPAHHVYFWS